MRSMSQRMRRAKICNVKQWRTISHKRRRTRQQLLNVILPLRLASSRRGFQLHRNWQRISSLKLLKSPNRSESSLRLKKDCDLLSQRKSANANNSFKIRPNKNSCKLVSRLPPTNVNLIADS